MEIDMNEISRTVPPQNFPEQFEKYRDEILPAIEKVLASGQFILGPAVEEFENHFKTWHGAQFAMGCNSGTDALIMALQALGIGPGDEVICPAFTYYATGSAIVRAGATPVFCDCDPETYTITVENIDAVMGPRVKAIIPVHLYGHPCKMDSIMSYAKEKNLAVIEDCSQSHGAMWQGKKTGTFGEVGCFSFYPTKNLGAYGDGGIAITDDLAIAESFRVLRHQGSNKRYHHDVIGMNSRLDSIQAAILNVKLKYLDAAIAKRRELAAFFDSEIQAAGLSEIQIPKTLKDAIHVYHLYTIRCSRRDELLAFLESKGIGSYVYYPIPLHLLKAFQSLDRRNHGLPVSEAASQETLALPLHPEMTQDDQVYILDALKEFFIKAVS